MNNREIMDQIKENFEKNANVSVCFGKPIDKDNITIIPVAKVKAGGGGGSGSANAPQKEKEIDSQTKNEVDTEEMDIHTKESPSASGGGIGIGITSTPLGYIEIKEGKTTFKPIQDNGKIALSGLVLSAFSVFFISVSIVRIFKICHRNTLRNDPKKQ